MGQLNRARAIGLSFATLFLAAASPAMAQQFVEESATRFPSPNPTDWTNQLTIGDLDNDGDLDIIFANGGNFSSSNPQIARCYINDGSGVFTDESVARLGGITGDFRGVELGDIDRDGDLDIAFAADFDVRPTLMINIGGGVFVDESSTRMPPALVSCPRIQFLDIDNDGDLDIFLSDGDGNRFGCGRNKVYVNDGNGFFNNETPARTPIGNFCAPMDCTVADVDGDFDLDVLNGNRDSNQSRLYINDGSGVFAFGAFPNSNRIYSYDFGDIDNDGDLDAFGANGNPAGNNSDLLVLNDGAGGFADISNQVSPNPTVDDNDSKFIDYDNDGDLDLIVARLGGSAERIYNNNGSGSFTEVTGLITGITDSSLDIMVADLNNDGRYDIVTGNGESGNFQNRIYINNGPVDTQPPTITALEQLPDTSDNVGPYVVRVAVTDSMSSDRNFFAQRVRLRYRVNGGPLILPSVDMPYSGGQIYRDEIPGLCSGVISYSVLVRDWAGNTTISPELMFTVTGTPAVGDVDGDCDQDADDLMIFTNVLIGSETNALYVMLSDINGDNARDGDDIQMFVDALLAP